jgi:hypothetical protein
MKDEENTTPLIKFYFYYGKGVNKLILSPVELMKQGIYAKLLVIFCTVCILSFFLTGCDSSSSDDFFQLNSWNLIIYSINNQIAGNWVCYTQSNNLNYPDEMKFVEHSFDGGTVYIASVAYHYSINYWGEVTSPSNPYNEEIRIENFNGQPDFRYIIMRQLPDMYISTNLQRIYKYYKGLFAYNVSDELISHYVPYGLNVSWAYPAALIRSWKTSSFLTPLEFVQNLGEPWLSKFNNNEDLAPGSETDAFFAEMSMQYETVTPPTALSLQGFLETKGLIMLKINSSGLNHWVAVGGIRGTSYSNTDKAEASVFDPYQPLNGYDWKYVKLSTLIAQAKAAFNDNKFHQAYLLRK